MKRLIRLTAVLLAAVSVPAFAQTAPDTSDKCTYNGNGIGGNALEPRSCASVGTAGDPSSYGAPRETYYGAIGNGHSGDVHQATTSTSNDGWSNGVSATSNSGNTVAASSSLTDGSLHGYVGNGTVAYTTGSVLNTRISDIINFSNTSGGAVVLNIGYSFDGFVAPIVKAGNAFYGDDGGFLGLSLAQSSGFYGPIRFANSGGYVGSSTADFSSKFYRDEGLQQTTDVQNPDDYKFAGGFNGDGTISGSFMTSLLIPTGTSDLGFALTLNLDCRSLGVVCDFSHTGRLNLGTLPSGLSYTSQSGHLFADAATIPGTSPGAVPEASSWAMMITGLGLAGGAMRRRRLATTMQIA